MPLSDEFDWSGLLPVRPAVPKEQQLRKRLAAKSILITGAGGSIGSALAKAIAEFSPRELVLMDAAEQSLYSIDRQIEAQHVSTVASVCDFAAVRELFERHHPEVVFHAAAFKHVPLMELNPFAAIQNNAIGTFLLARMAIKYQAERFVLVSTDKAVEPFSMMGASKRVAELIVLALPTEVTRMVVVRLGNVLGSQGSVLPLFLEQITHGGPVTVTHPDASRFFMTLDQAVQLLLLASSQLSSGILVPDLGEPIRIAELAERLVALHKGPSAKGAQIIFTELRPGDKMNEQLLSNRESYLESSSGPLRPIYSPEVPPQAVAGALEELQEAVETRDLDKLLETLLSLVPEYRPSALVTRFAGQSSARVTA